MREACPASAWSLGVSLARGGSVSLVSSSPDELVVRVTVAGAPLAPTVRLYPEDEAWECDCASPLDACEHVAASLIASRQGIVVASAPRALEYHLRRTHEGYDFERGVTMDGEFHVVDVPLDALAAGRFQGPDVAASAEDLDVEKALGGHLRGVLPQSSLPRVFAALSRVSVLLDGEPVRVSGTPRAPVVVVEDAATADGSRGFRVRFESKADDERTDELYPEIELQLSAREREDLLRGRVYPESEMGELVGAVIPGLERRTRVEVRSRRLPRASAERPKPSLRLSRVGDGLYVLPRVAYGDPPVAYVDGERLVAVGERVPRRDPTAEAAAAERLRHELGLTVGRGYELGTDAAIELVSGLERFGGVIEGDGRAQFRLHPALVPQVDLDEEHFDVSFGRASARAVLGAYRSGASHVPIEEGGFAPLPLDWLDLYGERVADLVAAREASRGLPRSMIPELARLADELGCEAPSSWRELQSLVADFESVPEAPLEPELAKRLRHYQREGVDWLWFAKRAGLGALLADDMGLGKTLQAICALETPSLVAAPTSVLANWRQELARFRPELTVNVFHGPSRSLDDSDVTLTTHALLRIDRERFEAREWDTVVLDEAQAIKNPDSRTWRAAAFRLQRRVSPDEP